MRNNVSIKRDTQCSNRQARILRGIYWMCYVWIRVWGALQTRNYVRKLSKITQYFSRQNVSSDHQQPYSIYIPKEWRKKCNDYSNRSQKYYINAPLRRVNQTHIIAWLASCVHTRQEWQTSKKQMRPTSAQQFTDTTNKINESLTNRALNEFPASIHSELWAVNM